MAADYAALKAGGFMRQKQKDMFSMRLRVVGGTVTVQQLKAIAEAAEKYGHSYVHLTSRQGLEIPFIRLEDIEEVKDCLARSDVEPGVCGPRVRTVTACQGGRCCPSGCIDALEIAEELGFRVMITTNATLLFKAGETLLRSKALHKVNLSLQSFEANDSDDLCAYLEGCVDFAERAAEKGVLCEFRLWNQGGLEERNREILALLKERFPTPWQPSRNGQRLAERIWLDPGERFDWPDLEKDSLREKGFCYGLRDQIGVLCDGTVVPCCLDHEGDIPLGNLFQQELDEILASPRARAIYEGFSRRQVVEPLCQRCGYAGRFQK